MGRAYAKVSQKKTEQPKIVHPIYFYPISITKKMKLNIFKYFGKLLFCIHILSNISLKKSTKIGRQKTSLICLFFGDQGF